MWTGRIFSLVLLQPDFDVMGIFLIIIAITDLWANIDWRAISDLRVIIIPKINGI
jgi:cell division protein FtsW (lipid II flippase)